MIETLRLIVELIQRGEVRVSAHGYDELAADGILAREVIAGVQAAVVVEDDPTYAKGPCVLVRQFDRSIRAGGPSTPSGEFPKARRHQPYIPQIAAAIRPNLSTRGQVSSVSASMSLTVSFSQVRSSRRSER
jgi:hypothetical protein